MAAVSRGVGEPRRDSGRQVSLAEVAKIPPTMTSREFILTSGERFTGVMISANDQEWLIESESIGRVKINRSVLAEGRIRKLMLLNGDRVAGEVLAETGEAIYLRHVSLGAVMVPTAHVCSNMAELSLKDGELLGEIVTEDPQKLELRSAGIGRVNVPMSAVSRRK